MKVQTIEQLRSRTTLRILSFITCLVLCLSISFSVLGSLTGLLIQTLASATLAIGTLLQLVQILVVIGLVDRGDRVGWVLHRFSYATLLAMILSFLLIVGARFLSSFSLSGGSLMLIAVTAYVLQASFGVCLATISYHFLKGTEAWREL